MLRYIKNQWVKSVPGIITYNIFRMERIVKSVMYLSKGVGLRYIPDQCHCPLRANFNANAINVQNLKSVTMIFDQQNVNKLVNGW